MIFETHIETCGFVSIDCPNGCGVKYEKRFVTKHQTEDCSKRTVTCEFCMINYFISNIITKFLIY